MSDSSILNPKKGIVKRKIRLSKNVQETLGKIFCQLEADFGIDAKDIAARYQDCYSALRKNSNNSPDNCKYFLRDGSPCPNPANPKTGLCSGHRSCAKKYKAIEHLFRRRFSHEQDQLADEIDLNKLSIQPVIKIESE